MSAHAFALAAKSASSCSRPRPCMANGHGKRLGRGPVPAPKAVYTSATARSTRTWLARMAPSSASRPGPPTLASRRASSAKHGTSARAWAPSSVTALKDRSSSCIPGSSATSCRSLLPGTPSRRSQLRTLEGSGGEAPARRPRPAAHWRRTACARATAPPSPMRFLARLSLRRQGLSEMPAAKASSARSFSSFASRLKLASRLPPPARKLARRLPSQMRLNERSRSSSAGALGAESASTRARRPTSCSSSPARLRARRGAPERARPSASASPTGLGPPMRLRPACGARCERPSCRSGGPIARASVSSAASGTGLLPRSRTETCFRLSASARQPSSLQPTSHRCKATWHPRMRIAVATAVTPPSPMGFPDSESVYSRSPLPTPGGKKLIAKASAPSAPTRLPANSRVARPPPERLRRAAAHSARSTQPRSVRRFPERSRDWRRGKLRCPGVASSEAASGPRAASSSCRRATRSSSTSSKPRSSRDASQRETCSRSSGSPALTGKSTGPCSDIS
mmetsp:Transcript_86545/g.273126  ORF Transcript_86545/g.273126 Transcript_86545/m.273126 type:complete len:512 (+) Transcript_86545:231-1766(+)